MAHIRLNLWVKAHPHSSKLRKRRGRRLRPIKPNRANELWYKSELLRLVRLLRQSAREHLLPLIKQGAFRGDAALPSSIAHQFSVMQRQFGRVDETAKRLSRIAAQKNLTSVDEHLVRNVRMAVGVDIRNALSNDGIREALTEATKANIDLITSIPEQYFGKLRTALEKNWKSGYRWEEMADVVEHIGDVTETRAKVIARDQTSKMNAAFNESRQTSLGIERYEWQTCEDERVREEHAELDGQVFEWDNPPIIHGEPLNPGEDILCRCTAIPIFDLDEMEEEVMNDDQ